MSFKILVVEDDRTTSTLLSKRLESVGFETRIAFDGAEALSQISSFFPNLILLAE